MFLHCSSSSLPLRSAFLPGRARLDFRMTASVSAGLLDPAVLPHGQHEPRARQQHPCVPLMAGNPKPSCGNKKEDAGSEGRLKGSVNAAGRKAGWEQARCPSTREPTSVPGCPVPAARLDPRSHGTDELPHQGDRPTCSTCSHLAFGFTSLSQRRS